MQKKIVGVLFGGKSTEHEVSIRSAKNIIESIDREKFEVVPLALTKTNHLVTKGGLTSREAIMAGGEAVLAQQCVLPKDDFDALPLAVLTKEIIDVVLPIMHGNFGEDGRLQGFLEMIDVPYVGSGVLASSVGMDKVVQKQLAASLHIPHTAFTSFHQKDWDADAEAVKNIVEQACGFPCFIKPANNGSSVGIGKAHNKEELDELITAALLYDTKVIAEEGVEAPREFEVSVLGHNTVEAVTHIAEIKPDREFYDYDSKYDATSVSEVIIPANIDDALRDRLRDLAVQIYKMINASGLSRVDFLMNKKGDIFFNEINTLPGFTSTSAYAMMWIAAGMPYPELIEKLIACAFEREEEQQNLRYEA